MTIGIAIGFWIGPDQEYYFLGVTTTLVLIFIYSAGNIGVYFLYRRQRPSEFNPVLHFVFPVLSTLSMVWDLITRSCPCPTRPWGMLPFWSGGGWFRGFLLLTVRRTSNMPLLPVEVTEGVEGQMSGDSVRVR